MKKALKRVIPSSFGACVGVALANELRDPSGLHLGSFLLSFAISFFVVTLILSVLFWLWDKIRGN